MKKIIIMFLLTFTFITNVYAENKLYFAEDETGLVYDTDLFEKELFLYHTDMMPGKEFEDSLIIYNASNQSCDLYLKIKEKTQDDLANELLENINMDIYLDNVLLYTGTAKGKDIVGDGVNIQDSIFIGNYKKDVNNKLVVKTELDKKYTNYHNTGESHIEWEFYANCANGSIVVINPDTGDKRGNMMGIIVLVTIISLILFYYLKYKLQKK